MSDSKVSISPEHTSAVAAAGMDVEQVESGVETSKPARKVSKALINFWLDVALLTAVVFLIWVSAMMQFVFPTPTRAAGWKLWGLTFDQWRDTQFGALCLCGLLGLEHLVLHWTWVCSVIATKVLRVRSRPDEGIQALYGVGIFIGVVMAMLTSILAAILTVKRPPG